MDLNELFFRHQIAVMRADRTCDAGKRGCLRTEADRLASRIDAVRLTLGAAPFARAAAA